VKAALSSEQWLGFKGLFRIVLARLRAAGVAGACGGPREGGEEILRLRAYNILLDLVSRGMVEKSGWQYRGIATRLAEPPATKFASNCEKLFEAIRAKECSGPFEFSNS
jgi:hypothetical protein